MHPGLPGAVGPAVEAARFADTWSRSTGAPARIAVRQRVHAAAGVAFPPARRPDACERPIPTRCRRWSTGCVPSRMRRSTRRLTSRTSSSPTAARRPIRDGAWLVWDDGGLVSIAGYGNPTPSGIRVGPVYTPPEHRGRGYATSLVAELTAERLAAGLAFCFLFTDLSNPTSNAIYARIGYEPVADWDQWSFLPLE